MRVGRRRACVRRSDPDRFLDAGYTSTEGSAPVRDAEDSVSLLWARLGRAVADSGSALAEADQPEVVRALNAVAEAASKLAEAICCAPFKIGTPAPLSMGIGGWGTKEEVSRVEWPFDTAARVDRSVAAPAPGVKRRERAGVDIDGCRGA